MLFFLIRTAAVCRITIAFFQYKFIHDVLDHQKQTVDPENIHNEIIFVIKSETEHRPSKKDEILHIVEKEDPYAVNLLQCLEHVSLEDPVQHQSSVCRQAYAPCLRVWLPVPLHTHSSAYALR